MFDEKLMTPLFNSERAALAEAANCVNFKRELSDYISGSAVWRTT